MLDQQAPALTQRRGSDSGKEVFVQQITGLHSYDLHLNLEYRKAFALDAVVPIKFLRGLPGHEIRMPSAAQR